MLGVITPTYVVTYVDINDCNSVVKDHVSIGMVTGIGIFFEDNKRKGGFH